MKATQYWINERLAIVSRPWGDQRLDDERVELREAGIDVLVSMLEEGEAVRLGLKDEGDAARRAGLVFVNFPIRDRVFRRTSNCSMSFSRAWRDTSPTGGGLACIATLVSGVLRLRWRAC
jgi:hypothetical protein